VRWHLERFALRQRQHHIHVLVVNNGTLFIISAAAGPSVQWCRHAFCIIEPVDVREADRPTPFSR